MVKYFKLYKPKIILMLSVSLLFLLSACQPTPENEVVAGKSDLEEMIEQNTASGQAYQAPPIWEETIKTDNGFLSIVIDAEVTVPDATSYPVVVIKPMQVSQQQADLAIQALFQGNTLYEISTIKTKDEIEQEILEIKAYLADTNSDLYLAKDSDPEYYQQVVDEFTAQIVTLEQQLAAAPEEYTPKPASLIFEDGKEILFPGLTEEMLEQIPDISLIRGEAYMGRTTPANIMIISDTTKSNNKIYYQNFDLSAYPNFSLYEEPDQESDLAVSVDEAAQTAEDLLFCMELSNMRLAAVGYDREVSKSSGDAKEYPVLFFSQCINDVPVSYVHSTSYTQTQAYTEPWPDEGLLIGVDEYGVNRFEWTAPMQTMEILSDNTTLLPFEDIIAVFKEQAKVQDIWNDGDPNIIGREVHITRIVLGLAKAPRADHPDEGLLVPAWEFYGYSIDQYAQQEEGGYPLDENNQYINEEFMNSYITLSAIDGSIIERTIMH